MSAPEYPFPRLGEEQQAAVAVPSRYAICIDLDPGILAQTYGPDWQSAYADVTRFLAEHGFVRRYGTVYFGNDTMIAVHCMMAVQRLAMEFDWFAAAASDVRMLRIEANNNLRPAMELAVNAKKRQ